LKKLLKLLEKSLLMPLKLQLKETKVKLKLLLTPSKIFKLSSKKKEHTLLNKKSLNQFLMLLLKFKNKKLRSQFRLLKLSEISLLKAP
jgi:hypothetical protein